MGTLRRCGRLAPSPTGALHVGNIRTFMVAWLQMRTCGGAVRLRIEDLDHPKHKAGSDERLIDDLRWLGFDWDGDVVYQSARQSLYLSALHALAPSLYPCTCSRADILQAQSAPHPGEVLRYPGSCRPQRLGGACPDAPLAPAGRDVAWRLALTPEDDGRFRDGFSTLPVRRAAEEAGDFVVARGADKACVAYALAVVVDDAEMGVTDVVRGDDILPATPSQVVLYQRLGLNLPTFWHVPLVVGEDHLRLAKRHGDTRIDTYRASGVTPGQILTALARSCGWLTPGEQVTTLSDLLPRFSLTTLPHAPFVWHDALLQP